MMINQTTVIVRGAGDLATGTIHCLSSCGFKVAALEVSRPTTIRRTVAFSEAMYQNEVCVEGVIAKKAVSPEVIEQCWNSGIVPVLEDSRGHWIDRLKPHIVIDAIIAKKNLGTNKSMAPLVIGLGPGFTAGEDVHVVIETQRGHRLGRIITEGCAMPNTGIPGSIAGVGKERVIHSPDAGIMHNIRRIADIVHKDEMIACVGDTPVYASISGILRGLLKDGLYVSKGFKIADIDPRISEKENCFTISDKARTIAGGVLQAILIYGDGHMNAESEQSRI